MKTKHKHWAVLTVSSLGITGLSFASGFRDEKYTYDASGNVLEKQIGDQVTRYDYTGNQLNGSESDSVRKQYAYDSSGRLTSVSEVGKATRNMERQYLDKVTKVQNGDKTTELFYNAEGQLVATNAAGISEILVWDDLAIVNCGEQIYVNETHVVGGVPAIVGNEVAVSDMIGTSLSVGSGTFESTAFGQGLTVGLFTGKPFVEDLGGFLFKYRTYSAGEGRWTSPDPIGYPDGKNNLSYVTGDPVSKIDPLGTITKDASNRVTIPGTNQPSVIVRYRYTYELNSNSGSSPKYDPNSAQLAGSVIGWSDQGCSIAPLTTPTDAPGYPNKEYWKDAQVTVTAKRAGVTAPYTNGDPTDNYKISTGYWEK